MTLASRFALASVGVAVVLCLGAARAVDAPNVAGEADPVASSSGIEIGGTVPDFELRDSEGAVHRLSSLTDARAIVIALSGVGCPVAKLYAPRLEELSKELRARGVAFLGLNSNAHDDVEEIRAFIKEHRIGFPILKDESHEVADMLGAERTTEVFVLDAKRTLRYRGAVDDQYSLDERSTGRRKAHPEKRWLRDAILALLEDRAVDPSLTTAAGCVLGRKPVEREKKPLTYHADVEPIIQERCQPCHRKGQIAPFELATFDDVAGWSGMIREVVENRRMPPWHANPSHGHFENDRSLSEAERETILGWIAAGAPRGNPTDAPPPKEFPGGGWQIGEPDVVLEMPRAYRVPAQGTVSYQYFTIRTSFDEDRWVQAMEVLPGAREVVHHILVFCVDPKNPRGWQRETGGGVRGYFGVMVPGERPCVYPEGLGKRLPKGATLVFQVHYTTNGRAVQDRSKIGLIFSRSPVRHEVRTQSAHETRLRIPPRTPDHQVRATYRFSRDAMLLSLLPHMHLRGSAFRYTAHYPEGVQLSRAPDRSRLPRALDRRVRWEDETKTLVFTGAMTEDELRALVELYDEPSDQSALADLRARTRSEILLDVPSYDFGWQSSYQLAEPKRMPRGTVIEALAVFDNSPSNRALTTEEWSSWVRWGEQTWEEMLIGYFDFYDVSGDDESTP